MQPFRLLSLMLPKICWSILAFQIKTQYKYFPKDCKWARYFKKVYSLIQNMQGACVCFLFLFFLCITIIGSQDRKRFLKLKIKRLWKLMANDIFLIITWLVKSMNDSKPQNTEMYYPSFLGFPRKWSLKRWAYVLLFYWHM